MLQHILLPFKSRLLATKEESNLTKRKCATLFVLNMLWLSCGVFVFLCLFLFFLGLQITFQKSLMWKNESICYRSIMFSSWWCLGRPLGLVGQRHWTTEKERVEKGAGSSYYTWVFHARRQVEKTSIARACSFTLLTLAYRVCSCSLLFKAPHPHLALCYYIFFLQSYSLYT